MAREELITGALSRLFSVGGLVGRVGVSLATDAVGSWFLSGEQRDARRLETLVGLGRQALETLGTLKGVPMKLGQMLSLHEGLLPPEVATILRGLQKAAPPVSFAIIQRAVRTELGERFDGIESLDQEVYAAASIGQVHRGRLADGRDVVFKVQYPGIDRVIASDLRNLRGVLRLLFVSFSGANFDDVWAEVEGRLYEELDYEREAANLERMAELQRDNQQLILPEVIPEFSSKRVLCMTRVEGLTGPTVEESPQELKDRWAAVLIETALGGLFGTGFLHADPNLANFAFREDGRVVMYDLGCMKEVPQQVSRSMAQIVAAILAEEDQRVSGLLAELGVRRRDGRELPPEMIAEYAHLFRKPFRANGNGSARVYRFGGAHDFYAEIIALGRRWWTQGLDLEFPSHVVFIDRTLNGHFGNLVRLQAGGRWRSLVERAIAPWL